jgi:hypothetical protein
MTGMDRTGETQPLSSSAKPQTVKKLNGNCPNFFFFDLETQDLPMIAVPYDKVYAMISDKNFV